MLFMGCVPQSKLAKVCAERFPVKEEITETIVTDTITIAGDTIRLNKTDTSYIICPPNKVITKVKEVKITAENTAKTHIIKQDCQKQLDSKDKEIGKIKKELINKEEKIAELKQKLEDVKKFKRWFYILIGIIALILGYRFSRWFNPLP
jgi:predicted RNase H-like nuclease (RuvC/YqgF family)